MQKNIFLGAVMVLGLISINTAAWAQEESATRQECVAQVTQVVDRIKADGFDAVAATITPGGPYSWKADGYVFCMDAEEGMMLAHPYLPPQMMNRPLMSWLDSNGKPFIREMVELAQKEGKGWVTYMSRFRGSPETRLKETYLVKVPNENMIVGAGYFPQTD